jgi:hypothetical protein
MEAAESPLAGSGRSWPIIPLTTLLRVLIAFSSEYPPVLPILAQWWTGDPD